jgi:FAD/FMN-containing dehydrogenase
MKLTTELAAIVGGAQVLTGADTARYSSDWTKRYVGQPLAVVRPGSTAEVSAVMKLAHATRTPVVPVSGNTGLAGGTYAKDALMISLDRMNRIREIRPDARIAVVEAGVILSNLHAACDAHDLVFPLTFGARGSAMIGGNLSTNAGGSNVLRYGNTRNLCLGIEVVLPDGQVLDMMTELRKDNSGYDLRDLFIGAEGTLGLITGAVLKLSPKPAAYATAMVAMARLGPALDLLNRLQMATGGAVEAFEYMPRHYIEQHQARFPDARPPFDRPHAVNILVEVGATAPRDATPNPDGSIPVVAYLEETLGAMLEAGEIEDAVVARTEAQRREMWTRREQAAEVHMERLPVLINDIAVPIDRVETFLDRMAAVLPGIDPGAVISVVSHLGDGNIHYTMWPGSQDPEVHDAITERVEEVALSLGGSFSAEHGIGLSKKPSMRRRKNPVAIGVMRTIKAALDPQGIMNPGKVLPD